MRNLAWVVLFATGCTDRAIGECGEDGPAFAANPTTGECWQFDTPCDVPDGWGACGDGEGEAEAEAESEGECEGVECPPGSGCRDGECVPLGGACAGDEDCADTQHCEFGVPAPGEGEGERAAPYPGGVCVDNPVCWADAECPAGQWCDLDAYAFICAYPDCGDPAPGRCRRGTAPPPVTSCYASADCAPGEYCTLDWGLCCDETLGGGAEGEDWACTGICAPACSAEIDCAIDEVCSADDWCDYGGGGEGEGEGDGEPGCAGLCVPDGCWTL